MKAKIISVAVCLVAVCASAQSRPALRPQRQSTQLVAQWVDLEEGKKPREGKKHRLLEPLLPFAEAVEKAKAGNPQGYYALAIHYAKGEAIERDSKKARKFIQKAAAADYGNAVLVDTICLEQSSVTEKERFCAVSFSAADLKPYCHGYIGTSWLTPFSDERGKHSLTNSADVAAIRAGYERAFNLGVSVATNELARFERRVEAAQAQIRKDADTAKQKAENAKLVEGLL